MNRLVFMALLLAAPAAAQPGTQAGTPLVGQELGQPLASRSPAKTYASTCAYCHGTNVGPIILGRHLPAAYISLMVRSGRNGMPAFRPSEITPAELDALTAWISKAPNNPKDHGQ